MNSEVERGVADIMAVTLAVYGAAPGLITGVVLYIIIERTSLSRSKKEKSVDQELDEAA